MGLAIFTPLAIAGAIFFMIHNMIAKTNTFLIAGMINKLKGTFYLKDIGGLMKQSPLLAVLFVIPAFALMGVPPLSGFFAKFILFKGGIESQHYIIVAVAVLTAMLTLYSMVKIWNEAFLKESPTKDLSSQPTVKLSFVHFLPSIILGLGSIFLGLFAESVYHFTAEAANQLIDSQAYINTVLNQNMP